MTKWYLILAIVPVLLTAQNGNNRGKSLYNGQPQNQTADCSHLNEQEMTFAAQLSEIHKTIFCQQFTPEQRQEAMALVKMKDPINTSPGQITPDHAVEIILQGARGQDDQNGQNDQSLSDQYHPQNQNGNGNGSKRTQKSDSCKRYK